MKKTCQFCSNEMSQGQTVFVHPDYWQDFTCHKCRCLFTFEKKKSKLIKYIMYLDKYRLDCNYYHNTFKVGVWVKDTLAQYNDVYTTNTIPTVTPENALDKIKTILVFL